MKIGFTGSKNGMTEQQKEVLAKLEVFTTGRVEVHHGDCIGSDADFHNIIRSISQKIIIITHPGFPAKNPQDLSLRAYCKSDNTTMAKSFFVRNRDIVDLTDLLIATPASKRETGGTWFTINYSRQLNKKRIIIYPDGSTGQ
jgi:hypothetical protein